MPQGERNEIRHQNYVRISRRLEDELFGQTKVRCFQFLNRDGEVMTVTDKDGTRPFQEVNWPRAQLLAAQIDASYIVNFNTRKILFRVMSPSNTPQWWPARVGINDSSHLNNAEQVPYEPNPDGSQPKKRRPSGAQNRKQYSRKS